MSLGVDLTTQTLGIRKSVRDGARKFGMGLVPVTAFHL
jgi:hypothetical protein